MTLKAGYCTGTTDIKTKPKLFTIMLPYTIRQKLSDGQLTKIV